VVSPWAVFIALFATVTSIVPWVASGLYFSLRCQRVTTAVVFNLLMPVLIYAIVPLVLLAIDNLVGRDRSDDLPEYTLLYLPWWYLGEGMNRFANLNSWDRTIYVFGTRFGMIEFVGLMIAAGIVQLGIAAGILGWMSYRFNQMVGRARG